MARRRYRKSAFPSIRKWCMKSSRMLVDDIFSPNNGKRTPEEESQVNSFVLANFFLGFFEPACWLIPLMATFRNKENVTNSTYTFQDTEIQPKKIIDIKNHPVFKELNIIKDNIAKSIKAYKDSINDYKKDLEIQKQKIKEISLSIKTCSKDEKLQLSGQKITEENKLINIKLETEKLRTKIAKQKTKIEKIKIQEYKLLHSTEEDIEKFSLDDFKLKLENGEI